MFSITQESKTTKIILFSMLAIFLFLCIFAAVYYNDKLLLGSFEEFNNDDVKYLRSAQTLLDTGKLTYNYPDKATCFIMPGIVFLLTPFVAIFGMEGAVLPVQIFFSILQTISIYLVFLIGRKAFNSKVALITVFLSVIYLPNIYVSTVILTEAFSYMLILTLILIIMEGTEKRDKKLFIIGGIVWGLSVMFRSTLAAFPLIVFVYWLIKKFKFKEMVNFGLCALIPFLIILSPWVIRNYIVFDKFVPLTYASGNPALQGTVIDYDRERHNKEVLPYIDTSDIKSERDEISENAAQSELASRIFKYNIKHNTGEYVKWYTIGKTVQNLKYPFMWRPIFLKEYKPIWDFHQYLLYTAAAVCLLMIVTKKFTDERWMLFTTFWFFNCIHLPFYCFPRYMYPAMFVVLLINAYLIYTIAATLIKHAKKIRRRNQLENSDNHSGI